MAPQRKSRSTWGRGMILLLVLVGLASSARAATYVVGGRSGWVELAPESISYDEAFQNIELFVGDSLLFTAAPGNQSVLRVPKDQLANCNGTNFLGSLNTTVPERNNSGNPGDWTGSGSSWPLRAVGYYGFISAVEEQCRLRGMHLAVNVSAPAPGSPPPDNADLVNSPPVTALAPAPAPAPSPGSSLSSSSASPISTPPSPSPGNTK